MFNIKRHTIIATLLLSLVLMTTSVMPGVALANDVQDSSRQYLHANTEQIEIIKDLWGKEIKFVDFLEEVAPVVLEDLPQSMLKQASVSDLNWSEISIETKKNLSDIDIYWKYKSDKEKEWFWVSIVPGTKQIRPIILSCLSCITPATSSDIGKRISIKYDDVTNLEIGSIVDIIQRTTPPGQVIQGEEPGISLGEERSSERSLLLYGPTETHSKAWTYAPVFGLITGEEAWQKFSWSGTYVTGITSQGGNWDRYWPFWVHESGFYQDNGPTPPASYHTTYAEGHFDYYQGGSAHEIDVWSYGYGNGTVNGAYNFSGTLPYDGEWTDFEYWIE